MPLETLRQEGTGHTIPFDEIILKTNTLCDMMWRQDQGGTFTGGCDYVRQRKQQPPTGMAATNIAMICGACSLHV
jgi:hypothetical protein